MENLIGNVYELKYLGVKLDKKLSFKEYLKDKFAKVNR